MRSTRWRYSATVSNAEESKGPFIKAAVFCERVLEEKDNVLSAIRIFDRSSAEIEVEGIADDEGIPEEIPHPLIQGALLVALVAGEAARNQVVNVRLVKPSGSTSPLAEFPIEFNADEDAAAQLILRLTLTAKEDGIYWFEILVGGDVRTRVPLRVTRTVKRRS